ncbi:MAG TPA: peptidoglycan DD-metalloendopeptidase family protein [Acidimicrobiales bacterium]|nr:peptidoglycan DD-metalloendopeptidase family protein [Acidimicrobiales bacterium]
MHIKTPRHLLIVATAAALSLVGSSMHAAVAQTGLPGLPGASGVNNGNTTTTAPALTSTVPTTLPASTVPTTLPTTTGVPTTAVPTTVAPITAAPGPLPGPMTSAKPPDTPSTTAPTAPAPSLSSGQVAEVLRSQQRSGASSTSALVDALRPLQNLGMTLEEALTLGMGQFPMLGVANWTDDWLDPRSGPPPHQHQGTDIFAAFDTPVRSPVDGIVRFEDAGLGGKGAFVTAPDGTYYYMAHLKGFNRDVGSGTAVKQGQVIGYNGDSGNAQGGAPHVHFEVHPGGGGAVNPKPFLDRWLAVAEARVDELIASFQPKAASGEAASVDEGVPQILVATGMTRRFSAPSQSVLSRERRTGDFNHAVLGPLTPAALASLLGPTNTDR